MATVANQRPDLFALVQCNVPVTDMLRFHKFTGGRAWKGEYGTSEDNDDVSKLLDWSPLHNIKAQKYPVMWIVTGDNDDRVVPSHALKYAAELQHTAGQIEGQNPIFLTVIPNNGHGSRVPASQWLALMAKVTDTQIKKD